MLMSGEEYKTNKIKQTTTIIGCPIGFDQEKRQFDVMYYLHTNLLPYKLLWNLIHPFCNSTNI